MEFAARAAASAARDASREAAAAERAASLEASAAATRASARGEDWPVGCPSPARRAPSAASAASRAASAAPLAAACAARAGSERSKSWSRAIPVPPLAALAPPAPGPLGVGGTYARGDLHRRDDGHGEQREGGHDYEQARGAQQMGHDEYPRFSDQRRLASGLFKLCVPSERRTIG